ncbi:nuclear transport factor 2 family protein [Leisingera sp. HS039]|uniref:ketosteroid isomerase-related protein n=1 Tax=unclassified Leisingera TaxID=2614906 RepID=UPI001070BCE7|nr:MULTISPECIES: ketosteroid isomerase-related protein [unclassified Leisingera]MBQ4824353.1 nuclear transport factor 2 family protein [Leisingera sp. HS039]QBR34890.1 isopropylmalate/homocitrate/citramalate synthase [Leisingera sp. NJS201]
MTDTIARYFAAFNAADTDAMLDCLDDQIAHHVNEGKIRVGKDKFAEFCAHMSRCYKEELTGMVIFSNGDGTRAAAEFIVNGTYLVTDEGLPEAKGQTYRLPGGSFFELKDGKISRVTTYYNLADWIAQVSAG